MTILDALRASLGMRKSAEVGIQPRFSSTAYPSVTLTPYMRMKLQNMKVQQFMQQRRAPQPAALSAVNRTYAQNLQSPAAPNSTNKKEISGQKPAGVGVSSSTVAPNMLSGLRSTLRPFTAGGVGVPSARANGLA